MLHPIEEGPDADLSPEIPWPAAVPEEEGSKRSCSFLKEGRFKGAGTASLGVVFCPTEAELRDRERTTIPPPPERGRPWPAMEEEG